MNGIDGLKIKVQENIDSDCIDVLLLETRDGKKYAGHIEWREVEPWPARTLPTFSVSLTAVNPLQNLADGLYDCGIHPTAAKGSAGQLSAVNRHLEDMRALVFKAGKP
jgi:hypothetical protein